MNSNTKRASAQPTALAPTAASSAGQRPDEQLGALHVRQQLARRAERPQHRELARALIAGRRDRREQDDQARREREAEQELDRAR